MVNSNLRFLSKIIALGYYNNILLEKKFILNLSEIGNRIKDNLIIMILTKGSLKGFFVSNLLEWGSDNYRNFDWRKDLSPYKVLISELMLQRTTATQVEVAFPSFIKKYSNTKKLASSDPDELLEIIKPLGLYQRRLKVFRTVAKQIEQDFKGKIPNEYDDLMELFGVGIYIANAILCFSFNEKVSIIDTNIIRIFQRFFNFKSDKKYIESDKKIWEFADNLIPEANYQLYNYTLLDFGSLVCKSKNPECDICILRKKCFFYNSKEED